EAQLLVRLELAGEVQLPAGRRAERVGAGADVPGAERKAILSGRGVVGHDWRGSYSRGTWTQNRSGVHRRPLGIIEGGSPGYGLAVGVRTGRYPDCLGSSAGSVGC